MVLSPDTIPFFHTDVVCAVSQGATLAQGIRHTPLCREPGCDWNWMKYSGRHSGVCLLLWLAALANCGGVLDSQPCYVLAVD